VVRTTLFEQAIAFVMVFGGGALLLAGVLLVASTRWINRRLGHVLAGLPLLSQTTGWLVTITGGLVLAIITFWPLFKFLPPVRIRWRDAWPATLLAAISWVLAVEFLTLYGRWFGYSTTGAIGGLFAALLWMNTVSQVLFFGAELCKLQYQATVSRPEAIRRMPPSVSRAS
jgi:membrane protein